MVEKRVKEQKSGGIGLLDILLPQLMIPLKGTYWIASKLHETAEKDLTDKSRIQHQLLELQMRYELEEIDDEEYERQETKLLDQLEAIRKYEEQKEGR
ncbi:gas vesicle protein GvpG [Acidobacteria bacterium AH-259-A15]|nr:gas vesicle protein GvpG [Acidobacteria bacterium AH-259-A15]MDA2936913.1 gas vesicle protein GvpG [Acidobacteria bacterium AH-259-A15]